MLVWDEIDLQRDFPLLGLQFAEEYRLDLVKLGSTNIMFVDIIRRPVFIFPERGASSIDWAKPNRFYLKTETESSLRNVVC
jgi:hypothetical protein